MAAVRRGRSLRAVARQFRVSPSTAHRWVKRARGRRLDRVDFSNRSSAPRRVANWVPEDMETLVLTIRRQLRDHSDLGEFGAQAIHRELRRQGMAAVPSLRTLGRILERQSLLREVAYRLPHRYYTE